MSTFDASQDQFNQYHFTVVEMDLPIVTGAASLTTAVELAEPQWYWKLNEETGTVATDTMLNGNLEYESAASSAGYNIIPSSADGLGSAKNIKGDTAWQIYDPVTLACRHLYDTQDYVARWELDTGSTVSAPTDYISRWTFDSNGTDSTGSSNLTLVGTPSFVAGYESNAMSLNGTTQHAELSSANSAPFELQTFSISMFAKVPNTIASLQEVFCSYFYQNNPQDRADGFKISVDTGGQFRYSEFANKVALTGYRLVVIQDLEDSIVDEWVHVGVVRTPTSIELYINGKMVDDTPIFQGDFTTMQPIIYDTLNQLSVGANIYRDNGAFSYFEGDIDETQFFDRALTANEVEAISRVAPDSSYGSHDGQTFGGVLSTTGQIGNALTFDGIDDYISIPDSAVLKPANITVSAWVNTSTTTAARIMSTHKFATPDYNGYNLFIQADGTIGITVFGGGNILGTDKGTAISTSTVNNGIWRFVVCSYDGTTVRIYVDGALDNSYAYSGGLTYNGTHDVRIGNINDSSGSGERAFFNGSIDDVRLYDRALSLTEIEGIFESRNVAPPVDFIAEWKMDSDVLDTTGAHPATAVGAPTYATGKEGNALVLNGTTQYATVVDNAALKPSQLTMSYWIKTTGISGIVYNNRQGVTGFVNYGYYGGVKDSGLPYARINKGTGNTPDIDFFTVTGSTIVNDGNWHHIAYTYDNANLKLYVDSVLVDTVAVVGGLVYNATQLIRIGRSETFDGISNYFNGSIDKLQLFNRAVTQAEVTAMYATTPVDCP